MFMQKINPKTKRLKQCLSKEVFSKVQIQKKKKALKQLVYWSWIQGCKSP
jgi:hypothetical protein